MFKIHAWIVDFYLRVSRFSLNSKRDSMARVILEKDVLGGELIFNLDELLSIAYIEPNIVLFLKGKNPVYLPLTQGNLNFLERMAPYFSSRLISSTASAFENLKAVSVHPQKP